MTLENTLTEAFQVVLHSNEPNFPFTVLFQQDEGSELVPTPDIPAFMTATGRGKDVIAEVIGNVCKELKPFAYVIIMEAWFLEQPVRPNEDINKILKERRSIANEPNRQECIIIIVGGRDRTLGRCWKIHRNKAGVRTALEKLDYMSTDDPRNGFMGRFADLNIAKEQVN